MTKGFLNRFFCIMKNDFPQLEKSLPKVRGKLLFNEPLSKKNWFGVGGTAQV